MFFKKQIHWYKLFENEAAANNFVKKGGLNSMNIGNVRRQARPPAANRVG